jgi:hypothetical protein
VDTLTNARGRETSAQSFQKKIQVGLHKKNVFIFLSLGFFLYGCSTFNAKYLLFISSTTCQP